MMRFATDNALGKLGRHLRAAGFDTLCQHQHPRDDFFTSMEADRVILTRTMAVKKRFNGRRLIFIKNDDPWRQLEQVVRELGIRRADTRPFSRCLQCNREIEPVARMTVKHRVPAFVWQRHQTFHQCGQCGRIYWAGSHHGRMDRRLKATFFHQGNANS